MSPAAPFAADPDTATESTTETRVEPDERTKLAPSWSVIVWDDPVNLQSYVVYVFQRLFGFSEDVANLKMLEVHNEGRSAVAHTDRERAEFFVTRLHAYGLQATMERSKDS